MKKILKLISVLAMLPVINNAYSQDEHSSQLPPQKPMEQVINNSYAQEIDLKFFQSDYLLEEFSEEIRSFCPKDLAEKCIMAYKEKLASETAEERRTKFYEEREAFRRELKSQIAKDKKTKSTYGDILHEKTTDEINRRLYEQYIDETVAEQVNYEQWMKLQPQRLIERYGQTEVDRITSISEEILRISEEGFIPEMKSQEEFRTMAAEQTKVFWDLSLMIENHLIYSMPLEILMQVLDKTDSLKKLHNYNEYDTMFRLILDGPNSLLGITETYLASTDDREKISNSISEILFGSFSIRGIDTNMPAPYRNKPNTERDGDRRRIKHSLQDYAVILAAKLPSELKETFKRTPFYKFYKTEIEAVERIL